MTSNPQSFSALHGLEDKIQLTAVLASALHMGSTQFFIFKFWSLLVYLVYYVVIGRQNNIFIILSKFATLYQCYYNSKLNNSPQLGTGTTITPE